MEVYGCKEDGSDLPSSDDDETCYSVPIGQRLECGFEEITKGECISRGMVVQAKTR